MLQHDLSFVFTHPVALRMHPGICRAVQRPTMQNLHHRHIGRRKMQPNSSAVMISTDQLKPDSENVLSPGLTEEGSIRFYRPRQSSKGRRGFQGMQSTGSWRAARGSACGSRDHVESLNHTAYLLRSARCPQAPGDESPAYSRFSSPGTPQPSQGTDALVPCAASAAKSHAAERQLSARQPGQFQLPPAELPNVSAVRSSAEGSQLQVSWRPGSVSMGSSKPQLSLLAGCCLKLLERTELAILQASVTLHSGVG